MTRPNFDLTSAIAIADQTAHEPDVVVRHDGAAWIVWSERGRKGDRIRFRALEGPIDPLVLSGDPGIAMQPAVETLGDQQLLVVWVTHFNEAWHLQWCIVTDGQSSSPGTVCSAREGLFHPRLLSQPDSGCRLVCERVKFHFTLRTIHFTLSIVRDSFEDNRVY